MSGTYSTFQQGIPNLTTPIVDAQGRLTPPWVRVMQSLLGRTGGTTGVNSDQLAASVSSASTSATQAGTQAQSAATSAQAAQVSANQAQASASQATLLAMVDTTAATTADQSAALLALFMES